MDKKRVEFSDHLQCNECKGSPDEQHDTKKAIGKENKALMNNILLKEEKSLSEESFKTFHEQDEKWRDAKVDARQHLSHREAHSEYRAELTRAIARYQVKECCCVITCVGFHCCCCCCCCFVRQ